MNDDDDRLTWSGCLLVLVIAAAAWLTVGGIVLVLVSVGVWLFDRLRR